MHEAKHFKCQQRAMRKNALGIAACKLSAERGELPPQGREPTFSRPRWGNLPLRFFFATSPPATLRASPTNFLGADAPAEPPRRRETGTLARGTTVPTGPTAGGDRSSTAATSPTALKICPRAGMPLARPMQKVQSAAAGCWVTQDMCNHQFILNLSGLLCGRGKYILDEQR